MEIEHKIRSGSFDALSERSDVRQILAKRRIAGGRVDEDTDTESVPATIGDEPSEKVVDLLACRILVLRVVLFILWQHGNVTAYVTRLCVQRDAHEHAKNR